MHHRGRKHQRAHTDLIERGRQELADLVDSVAPTVESTIHDLTEKAPPMLEKGQKLARKKRKELRSQLAEALPEPVVDRLPMENPRKKRRRVRTFLLVGGLGAAGVLVARKLMDTRAESGWQSAYPSRTPETGSMPSGGPAADTTVPPTSTPDDRGAASLDEALSDETEHPHRDTTPDDPAFVEKLDDPAKPGQGR